ncbi:MAG: hypothetical protein EXR71_03590 [Myxococcales bacterium]|nr:hypothetical protein [Myxococcales bacterium]
MWLLLAGCEALSSSDVANDELYVEVLVTTEGTQTQVDAKLQRGQGLGWAPVTVADDEAIVAVIGETEAEMEAVDLGLGNIAYTTLTDLPCGGLDAGVRFERVQEDTITGTVVAVPPDFAVTSPIVGSVLTAEAVLVVTWAPAWTEGDVAVTLSGECIPGWEIPASGDVGYAEIPAEALVAEAASCTATLSVIRTAAGTLPEAWGAGGTVGAQNGRMVALAVAY